MKRYKLRKYNYAVLWLALLIAVAAVWVFGREHRAEDDPVDTLVQSESGETASTAQSVTQNEVKTDDEMLGCWVPYMSLATENHTQAEFEANFKAIADSAKSKGLNALFVHVRPFCDALYKSKFYPWSHIVTGTQGLEPDFDPLAFMIEYTHGLDMEFHAWINPLRVKTAETAIELSDDNPYMVLKDESPNYFMEYNGGVYLNPAYRYVRSLVADGAAEIAENYDVDGIHFDDYFYPTQDGEIDNEAYEQYTATADEPVSLLEWRQANINAMVQEVYIKIKAANESVSFGISPQGNIENDLNMGADVEAWCAVSGYIDYICPQLYYSFENPALGFNEALCGWLALQKYDGMKIYAGLGLYKAGTDADSGTWLLSDDNIGRQIEAARVAGLNGVVLYSSEYLDCEQTEDEVENAVAIIMPN